MLWLLKLTPLLFYRTKTRAVIINNGAGRSVCLGYEQYREPTVLTEFLGFIGLLVIVACFTLGLVALGVTP